jgi:hypothetical protein
VVASWYRIKYSLLLPHREGARKGADWEQVELLAWWVSGTSALCGGGGRPRGEDGGCYFQGLQLEVEDLAAYSKVVRR